MKPLNEKSRNNKRFERLNEDKKELLNHLSIKEFEKPISERRKAVDLLDAIEFIIFNKNLLK
jgi:hypothetical protein